MDDDLAAAGAELGSLTWPAGAVPVAVLHDRVSYPPDPDRKLTAGDRVALLLPHLAGSADGQLTGTAATHGATAVAGEPGGGEGEDTG